MTGAEPGVCMTRATTTRRAFTVGLATAPVLASIGRALAAEGVGAVTEVAGLAFAEVPGGARPLLPAGPVFLDEWLRTGENSRLALTLGSAATVVRLGQTARLKIDRFLVEAGGVLELGGGALFFSAPRGAHPRGLTVRSPSALIAVRGTRFFAGPSAGAFGVFVEEGRVSVRAGGRAVTVEPGEGVQIATPGGPPTTPARWSDARIAAALASVR